MHPRTLTSPIRLGIIGGGQLARMLALKAPELGLRVFILCQSLDEPAAQVVKDVILGDPGLSKDLESFFAKVDLLTFESEFYDARLIEKVCDEVQVPIFPSASAMAILQDRLTQKQTIAKHLKTSDFVEVRDLQQIPSLMQMFPQGFVLKKRLGGYDGNGTFVVKNQMDLLRTADLLKNEAPHFIAEAFVPFEKELALIVARNQKGHFVYYPLVESQQLQNRCDTILGPAQHDKFKEVILGISALLEELNYVGVMGIEMFATAQDILINELAPRVHNSGHYTQNCSNVDQFKLHLMAVLNENLPEPQVFAPHFAMKNLIGSGDKIAKVDANLHGSLHWYGKTQNRLGRKMGHLNYVGQTKAGVLQAIAEDLTHIHL